MLHFDFTWDLSSERIILDEELDISKLGWKEGDVFKFIDIDGKRQLVKLDPLGKFIRGIE